MMKLLETYVIKEVIIDPLKMRKSKEKWILKYTILDDPNTMIIMGFNKGIISLYDISHLRFDGDILEVDNVFSRMYFMFMWYYWCWIIFYVFWKVISYKVVIFFLFNYYKSYFNCSFSNHWIFKTLNILLIT